MKYQEIRAASILVSRYTDYILNREIYEHMEKTQALEIQLTLEIMKLNKNIENVRKQRKSDYLITVYQTLINEKEDELRLLQCVES